MTGFDVNTNVGPGRVPYAGGDGDATKIQQTPPPSNVPITDSLIGADLEILNIAIAINGNTIPPLPSIDNLPPALSALLNLVNLLGDTLPFSFSDNFSDVASDGSQALNNAADASGSALPPGAQKQLTMMTYMLAIKDAIGQLKEELATISQSSIIDDKTRILALLGGLKEASNLTSLMTLRDELTNLQDSSEPGSQSVYLGLHPEIMLQLKQQGIMPPLNPQSSYSGMARQEAADKQPPYDTPVYAALAQSLPPGWEEISKTDLQGLINQVNTAISQAKDGIGIAGALYQNLVDSSSIMLGVTPHISNDPQLANMISLRNQLDQYQQAGNGVTSFNLGEHPDLMLQMQQYNIQIPPGDGGANAGSVPLTPPPGGVLLLTPAQLQGVIGQLDSAIAQRSAQQPPMTLGDSLASTPSILNPVVLDSIANVLEVFNPCGALIDGMIQSQISSMVENGDISFAQGVIFSTLLNNLMTTQVLASILNYRNLATMSDEDGLTYNTNLVLSSVKDRMTTFINNSVADSILNSVYGNDVPLSDIEGNTLSNVLTGFALGLNMASALNFQGDAPTLTDLIQMYAGASDLASFVPIALLLLQGDQGTAGTLPDTAAADTGDTATAGLDTSQGVQGSLGGLDNNTLNAINPNLIAAAVLGKQMDEIADLTAMIKFLQKVLLDLVSEGGTDLAAAVADLAKVMGKQQDGGQNLSMVAI